MTTYRDLIETWFQKVWVEGDTGYIYRACHPDMSAEGHGEEPRQGPEGFETFYKLLHRLADNFQPTVTHVLEDGDWLCARYVFTCRMKKTGQTVTFPCTVLCRVKDNQFIEVLDNVDWISFFEAGNLMPGHTLETCLNGTAIY